MAPGDGSDGSLPRPALGGQPSQELEPPAAAAGDGNGSSNTSGDSGSGDRFWSSEYSLRKYLLLLATVVATVTYTAGFSPPGGVWEETDPAAHYVAGDPILRHTSYRRYVAFFYLNAAAFASSLVVIVLILIISIRYDKHKIKNKDDQGGRLEALHVLRGFMVLDLLSIMGAYTAGIYRDRDVPVYTMILAALTMVYVVVFYMVHQLPCPDNANREHSKEQERPRKVLMLLATFAVSVTYVAGLSAPGGFRDDDEGGHEPGEPVLMGSRHETRFKAFVHFNSTAFFFSLLITVQLLDKNLNMEDGKAPRSGALYGSIVLALIGLICAYATGSSRNTDTTVYVTLLGVAVPACTVLLRVLLHCKDQGHGGGDEEEHNNQNQEANRDGEEEDKAEDKARSLILLLATLAATITYQAGLDPPGGIWEEDGNGHMAGDPILQTTNPRRYDAFFYCNSGALVASLIAIILVRKKIFGFDTIHALQAAMILDLFGLIGAYAAGSCRDVSTSIYAMALAGAVLVYVVIHVVFFTLDHKDATGGSDDGEQVLVEKRRKRLLLFAILAATITYQAGLTPPGGFWVRNEVGHLAGDPVLLSNSPGRYRAFFYCNSVSFMLSIALIILLVNPNLYRPAIRSHALSVCTAAGTFSLVGAFAAGSTQYLGTSIRIFGLVSAILVVAILALAVLHHRNRLKGNDDDGERITHRHGGAGRAKEKDDNRQQHAWRKHLMVLGILVASITYQAGLEPPGGVWQDDDDVLGHVAGSPIMRDNGRNRYLTFFYTNSTSFVASVVVIILLLHPIIINNDDTEKFRRRQSIRGFIKTPWWRLAMYRTIEMDLLGLLVAYAVGSTRSWKATGYVIVLVFSVLAYIAIHALFLAWLTSSRNDRTEEGNAVHPKPASQPSQEPRSETMAEP